MGQRGAEGRRTFAVLAVVVGGLAACAGAPDATHPRETSPQSRPAPRPDLDALWDFADPAASERRFREAAETAAAAGDGHLVLEAWTQVARAQGLQGRFDDARGTLARVAAGFHGSSEFTVPFVRWHLESGRVLRSSGNPAKAESDFRAAWLMAREIGADALAVDAAHMVAIVAPPGEALAWTRRGIDLAESSSDPRARAWLGPLYHNAGWTHFDRGEVDAAVNLWRKAADVRAAGKDAKAKRIAWWTWARGLRAQGRLGEALEVQERLRRETDEAGTPDGYVHEEIAEILLALGRRDEATASFRRAWELLRDADDVTSDPVRSQRLRTAAGAVE